MSEPCRCGRFDGTGEHLCHGSVDGVEPYTCQAVGVERLYVPSWRFSLAGAQMKASAAKTIACDSCWAAFQKRRDAA